MRGNHGMHGSRRRSRLTSVEPDVFDQLFDGVPSPSEAAPAGDPEGGGKKRKNPDHRRRTREMFLGAGWHYALVEHYNDFTGKKRDLWGFGDAVAFRRGHSGVVAVQYCSKPGILPHIRKACSNDSGSAVNSNPGVVLVDWLSSGNRFLVVGWEKVGRRWCPTIVDVTLGVVRHVHSGQRMFLAAMPKLEALP